MPAVDMRHNMASAGPLAFRIQLTLSDLPLPGFGSAAGY